MAETWTCPKCGLAVEDDENAALLPDSGFIEAHVTCIPEGSLRVWRERVWTADLLRAEGES